MAAVAAACAAWAAPALGGERADYALGLETRAPGSPTGLTIHVRFKAAGDPEAKPSPIRKAVIAAPAGTRFVLDAVPVCTATDDELRARGRDACPPASRVGAGTLKAFTGFGAPADPIEGDVTVFNAPGGFLELVTEPQSGRGVAIDRARVEGSTATLAPPETPGGPPDGQTAVREIDLTFDVPAYLRTPPDCPAEGLWRSSGTFTFADGVTVTEPGTTPCDAAAGAPVPAPAPARGRLVVRPRRLPAGRTKNLRLHVRRASPDCRAGAAVRIGRRRARTGRDGRVVLPVRLRRGTHWVTVRRPGCPALSGSVRVA